MRYQEYSDPSDRSQKATAEKSSPFARFIASGRYPIEQRIEDKKRGIGRQRYPFVGMSLSLDPDRRLSSKATLVWLLSIVMAGVFINELVVNSRAQGTPVSFKVRGSCVHCCFLSTYREAGRQPDARSILKRPHQCWSPFPTLHEAR